MLRFKVYYFNLTWEPKFKSLTLLEIQRAVEVEFMRIIKWLATGFEKKQPGVDIDLISSRCFNGLTVRWLYNLWFNLAFHFFSSSFTFRLISFSNKTMCTSMFISRLSSWGFFFPPIRIDLWREDEGRGRSNGVDVFRSRFSICPVVQFHLFSIHPVQFHFVKHKQ